MKWISSALALALCWQIQAVGQDVTSNSTLESALAARKALRSADIEYRAKKEFLVNYAEWIKDNGVERNYQSYEFPLRKAFDRGKRMHYYSAPLVVDGQGITEGETKEITQVYDGATVKRRIAEKDYVISRKPERYGGPADAWRMLDKLLTTVFDEMADNDIQIEENIDGDAITVRLTLPGESPTEVTLLVNASRGYSTEKAEVSYEDGSGAEIVFSDFRELPEGGWFPMKGQYVSYLPGKVLRQRYDHEVVKAELNPKNMDPAIFSMEIPADANVMHADLGILLRPDEIAAMAADVFENPELMALRIKEERAATDGMDAASLPIRKEGAAAGTRGETAARADRKWHLLVSVVLCTVLGIAILFGMYKYRSRG